MAKDTYYFKHDSNARNDIKLIKVRRKYKMEGYGTYFALIEILREQANHKLPLADIPDLAYDLNVNEKIATSIIKDFGLFIVENDSFYSASLNQRMSDYNEQKSKRIAASRIAGKASAAKRTERPSNKRQRNVERTLNDGQPLDYTTLHYTTLDYTTLQKTKELTQWAFDCFWEMYGKPSDKKKCFEKFDKLEVLEWEKIFQTLPDYVRSTPEVQYRKNPATYLNGKCWNDLVTAQPKNNAITYLNAPPGYTPPKLQL